MSGIKKFNAVQGFSVGESTIYDVIDNGANVTANHLVVNRTTNLGDIGNITITGGSDGYVLKTDGSGTLSWENPADVGVAGSNTQIQFNDNNLFGASANLTYNKTTKTLTVDNIVANGVGITNIYGPNVTDVVANANYAAYAGNVTINAQPNITSVGTLTSLRVTGNITSGNANLGNLAYAQYLGGTLTAAYAIQPNITSVGTLESLTIDGLGSVTGANLVSATYLTGTLTTKVQPNITSVGTLTTLRVTGNTTSGNANLGNLVTANFFTGDGYLLSNITGANVTGTVANAEVANTVSQNSQPNITSLGTLTGLNVSGDVGVTGNLTVTGSLEYANVTTFRVKDPLIEQGGNTTGTALTSNDGYDRGQILHYYAGHAIDAFMGWDNSNAEFALGSNVSVTSEVVTFNEFGNLRLNYIFANASQLTGTIANANYAAYAGNVTVNAQPNITSVGTLVSANVSGNITSGGNVLITANVSANNANLGNLVTANYFTGNGSLLTSLTGANVTGWVPNANIANTVVVADQPNITSVGTLVSANVSGNITSGGNILVTANISSGNANLGNLATANYFTGNGSLLRSLTGANVTGWVPNANIANTVVVADQPNITSVGTLVDVTMAGPNSLSGGNLVSANYITGTLTTKVQPNITSLGTLTGLAVSGDTTLTGNLTVTGAIEIANVTTFKVKDPLIEQGGTTTGSPLTSNDGYDRGQILHYYAGSAIDAFMGWDNSNAEFAFGSNVSVTSEVVTFNEFGNVRASTFLGNIVSSTLTGQLTTNNQPNITTVGTLSTLNVAGNITSGGNVLVTANISSGNANLGNLVTANYFTGTLTTNAQPNITSLGSLTGLTVSNATGVVNFTTTANVTLGNVSNLHITGGTADYVLKTDGTGNLVWASPTTVGVSGSNTQVQFNDNSNFAGSANFTFDKTTSTLSVTGQVKRNNMSLMAFVSSSTAPSNPVAGDEWYDRDNDTIYKYIYDGTSYYWIDVSSGYIGANISAVGNTLVQRDTNANVTANYFIGNGSMLTGVGSAGGLSNGTSNINAGTLNGNITVGIAGVSNTIVFTSTGITTIATGGINAGNLLTANYVAGTLTTAAQPNITSVGTLATTTMAANANIAMSGSLSQIAGANLVSATYLTGTLTTAVQPNITSVGTLASLTVTANISSGNANLGNLITSNYYTGTLTTASQPNITNVGSLTGLTVSNATGVVNFTTTANVTLGAVGNLHITGGTSGQVLSTNGSGGLSWTTISGSSISNGTSNINAGILNGNITVGVAGTANTVIFTSTGINVAGYATITGNITGGNITSSGILSVTGNANVGNLGTAGLITATGNVTGGNLTTAGQVVSTVATGTAPLSVTSTTRVANLNVNYANVADYGVVTAQTTGTFYPVFVSSNTTGNYAHASNTNINVSVATGAFNATLLGGTLTTAAQPNITSVGTLASLTVTANISSGNANLGNLVTANYFTGTLTTAAQPNITSVGTLTTLTSGTHTISANSNIAMSGTLSQISGANLVSATYLTGTLTTAAQPNITSVGTLSSLTVTANISSGNANLGNLVTANFFSGAGNLLSNIQAANITGTIANANYAAYAGNVTGNAQPNITSVGTLTTLNVTGNITSGGATGGNISGANNISANTFTGNLTTAAQPNITSVGTLSSLTVSGDTTLTGNLTVTGTFEYANVTSFKVKDPIIEQGGNPNGTALSSNDGYDRGQILHYYSGSAIDAFMGWDNSNAEFAFGSNVSVTSEVVTFNQFGNIRAGYFLGNASQLTGTIANANYAAYAGTVTTNAQPNITSVGTLAGLTGTGTINFVGASNVSLGSNTNVHITGGTSGQYLYTDGAGNLAWGTIATAALSNGTSNVSIPLVNGNVIVGVGGNTTMTVTTTGADVTGYLTVTGNANLGNLVTANFFSGSGNLLSNIQGANVSGQVSNSLIAGTVYSNAQPNITSVGTLSSLSVSGNITSGNATLGNLVTANYFSGDGSLLTGVSATTATTATTAGTVTTNAQPNITSVGTLSSLTVTANISSGNANLGNLVTANFFSGSGNLLSNIQAANITGTVANANYAAYAGNITVNAQPNITSVGTLAGLTATGVVDLTNASNVSLGSNANVHITGGTAGQYLYTDGAGNLSWATIATASLSNGSSNVSIPLVNGNVVLGSGGNTTMVVTSTGANVTGYMNVTGNITGGNATLGNLVTANYFSGNGSLLTEIAGANVTGTVANANYATYAGTAYSVSGSNVSGEVAFANVANNVAGANVSGQVGNALVAGTVYTNAQPNITSVGTLSSLSVSGDTTLTGNLTVTGTFEYANVTSFRVQDPIIEQGGNVSGGALTSNDGYDRGQILHYYAGSAIDAFMGWDNSNAEFAFGSNVSVTSEVVTFNEFGNVRASYFLGNGSQLTGVTATTAGTVTTNAQPNITSVGTLSSLNVTGNVSSGANLIGKLFSSTNTTLAMPGPGNVSGERVRLYDFNNPSATNFAIGVEDHYIWNAVDATTAGFKWYGGNVLAATLIANGQFTTVGNITSANANLGNLVTANYFSGDGHLLTNITGGNVTGQVGNALVAGTVYTNAQPNITSVGTLSSLDVTGNITAAYLVGNGSQLTGLPAGYANSNVDAYLPTYTGNISGNIVTLTGNITAINADLGNLVTANYFSGDGGLLSNITGSNVTGQVANAGYADYAGTAYSIDGANVTGQVANAGYADYSGTAYAVDGANVTGQVANAGYADYSGTAYSVDGANVTGQVANAGYADYAGTAYSISGSNVSGDVSGADHANIADAANVAYSVDGANVTGQVGNALIAGTVYTNAQPNITSVGTLSDLTVAGTTDLGSLANVKITGGAPGYSITTDGSGNLSWSSSAGGGTASFVAVSKDSFTGNGVADTFTLSVTPSSVQAIVVNINGIVQLSTAYSLSGADVSFGSAPASGVKIEVTTYGVVSFSGTAGQIQYSNGSGFSSSSGLTFNSTTNALSVSGNGTFSGGYLTLDSGIIAVSSGNAGIFTSGIGNVNIGLAGNVTLGGTSSNVTARGNFVANTITSNSTISGDTVTATNLRMNDLYSNRTPINVTGTTVIDSFALNKYRTAKYTIRVGSDDGYQSIEVLLIHDAVTSLITVYGSISTSGYDIVLLTSGINSGNVELLATTGSANTTVNLIGTYVAD